MKNEINGFEIYPIGMAYTKGNMQIISVYKNYVGGLKYLSLFSHAIIIYFDSEGNHNIFNTLLSQKVVCLSDVDEKTGLIQTDIFGRCEGDFEIYDIKPYFPNEDRVKDCFMSGNIEYTKSNHLNVSSNLVPLGTIHKSSGEFYLEIKNNFPESIQSIKGYSHIKIFWWFHKFDKASYRRTVECQPPYENAPRTGVFASRSPMRPNPIALTTAKILSVDEEKCMIRVSKLDCFDNTPFVGFSPYNPNTDCISDYHLPKWLNHWPEWLDDREIETVKSDIAIKKSSVENIQKYILADDESNKENELYTEPVEFSADSQDGIVIKGARQNNLKNIDVTIPYRKITVITGVSGSGKSSLAFDTIFSESQHRFLESMSLSERSQFKRLEKPQYDKITGLPPSIAISQTNVSRNPRSTVGTMTDVYNLLRSLFATIGVRHCPECGNAIVPLTVEEIVEILKKCIPQTKICIKPYGNEEDVSCFIVPDSENESLKAYWTKFKIDVVKSLELGNGAINVILNEKDTLLFQTTQMCYCCNHVFFELSQSDFSFNNPESMCPICKGLGNTMEIDADMIISKPDISILDGASSFWGNLRKFGEEPNANWTKGEILALAVEMGIDLENSWNNLPDNFKKCALYGTGTKKVTFTYKNKNGRSGNITRPVEGAYNAINRYYKSSTGDSSRLISENYMNVKTCDCCNGERLSKESRMVTILDTRFPEVVKMSIEELKLWIESLPLKLSKSEINIVLPILKEIHSRVCNFIQAGLSYLTLDRSAPTLSGGELQRLRLVTQLSSGITNILYILDEPSSGLHYKDHCKLLDVIKKLKDLGNTVIIVEHDEETMLSADYIIDIGSCAGESGGYIVAQGTPKQIMENDSSETGKFLSGKKQVSLCSISQSNIVKEWVKLTGVMGNNLKNINIKFPSSSITCITGVSGSGKSSLIANGIYPAINTSLNGMENHHKQYDIVTGADKFDKIVSITQKPIGRTACSNIATYTGMMDEIRSIFAQTNEAKQRGFKSNRFSFNSKEGQCAVCHGEGQKTLQLHFMPDTSILCPVCKGKKYNGETLEIKYNGKSISDVLEMSVEKALKFFHDSSKLNSILNTLSDIGLGYIKLGQSSLTLSGGEAQRVKLASELSLSDTGKTLYLLDEPTTGLHFKDIQNLLIMLRKITCNGNTVILVEHNIDMIRNCDWIIDLGLEGGTRGGNVVAQGTPSEIASCEKSYTGEILRKFYVGN